MKQVSKLSKEVFKNTNCVSIGKLDTQMIDFIIDKKPELGAILSDKTDIIFWKDRIKHTSKHIKDFASKEEYNFCLKNIPMIVNHPDYISIHSTDSSISFIKDFEGHTSVAVRISPNGKMAFRTMYPLREAQLNNYLQNGRAWKFSKKID